MRNSLFKGVVFLTPLTLFLASVLLSCNTTKRVKYFQDLPDSGQLKAISSANYKAPTIQIDDILTIIVQSIEPSATASINLGNVPTQATGITSQASSANTQPAISGYLVTKDGYVEMPVLGRIKLVGYTTAEAREIVLKEAQKWFKDPSVIVRYANFKISVTGEVLKPGQYIMPNEKVGILDALAMAGDLTIFGKRENVLLIRENEDGSRTPFRVNLKNSNIMSMPYYYLKQNDIIYVEPRKSKSDATDASQTKYITIAGTILSIILILTTRRL